MTNPTISYRNGFAEDCNDASSYAETEHAGVTATLEVDNDDIFHINVTANPGAYVYYEYDLNPNISSNTYRKFIVRYKTGDSNIKTYVRLMFTSGSQILFPKNSSSSTTWKTVTGDITAGKTIDKIRFYAWDTTGDVYFDFLLICKGTFTFPHVGPGGVFPDLENKIAEIGIPGRDGDVQQHLGMKSPTIVIEGDVLSGESGWDSGAGPTFEYLLDAFHKDVWNWFTCDFPDLSFQVMFKRFQPVNRVTEGKATLGYRVTLKVHKRSSLGLATWGDVEWIGYE